MRYLSFLITVPLSLFCLFFAVSNTEKVQVSLTPVGPEAHLPLWLVGLGLMAAGFVCGALLLWIASLGLRLSRLKALSRLARLERELQNRPSIQENPALPPPV